MEQSEEALHQRTLEIQSELAKKIQALSGDDAKRLLYEMSMVYYTVDDDHTYKIALGDVLDQFEAPSPAVDDDIEWEDLYRMLQNGGELTYRAALTILD